MGRKRDCFAWKSPLSEKSSHGKCDVLPLYEVLWGVVLKKRCGEAVPRTVTKGSAGVVSPWKMCWTLQYCMCKLRLYASGSQPFLSHEPL